MGACASADFVCRCDQLWLVLVAAAESAGRDERQGVGVSARGSFSKTESRRILSLISVHWCAWQSAVDVLCVTNWNTTDRDVTAVQLQDADVDDTWLIHLKSFPKLQHLRIDDRQLSAGPSNLRGLKQLTDLSITNVSNRHLVELQRLPQIQLLSLWQPQTGDIGMRPLSLMPNLSQLIIGDCPHTGEILKQLPETRN